MAGLKVHQVAARLNVSDKTVYKWLKQGLIPASRIGKTWIITEESLDALVSPGQEAPTNGGRAAVVTRSGVADDASTRVPASPEFSEDRARLSSALSHLYGMMSGAVDQGIIGVLGPRRLDPATPTAIAHALESAEGEVLLQGVGLREFFGDRDHAVILRRMAAEDHNVSVRALLVNPTGQFARARTVVEDGEQFADDTLFRAGPLFGDSWRSLNVIASLRKASKESRNFRLDVRFLDHWPSAYFVLTDRCAFIETYHFGRSNAEVENSTIDGLVPMLQVSAGSSYYGLLRNHFDYLWSGRNPFVHSQTLEEVADSVQVRV